jgi:hypothetical protein
MILDYLQHRNVVDSAQGGGGVVRGTSSSSSFLLFRLHSQGQPARSAIHHIFVFRLSCQHLFSDFAQFVFRCRYILGIYRFTTLSLNGPHIFWSRFNCHFFRFSSTTQFIMFNLLRSIYYVHFIAFNLLRSIYYVQFITFNFLARSPAFVYEVHVCSPISSLGIRSIGCFALYALLRHYYAIAASLLRLCYVTTALLLRHCYVGCAFSMLPWPPFGLIFTFSSTRLGAIETHRFSPVLLRCTLRHFYAIPGTTEA